MRMSMFIIVCSNVQYNYKLLLLYLNDYCSQLMCCQLYLCVSVCVMCACVSLILYVRTDTESFDRFILGANLAYLRIIRLDKYISLCFIRVNVVRG